VAGVILFHGIVIDGGGAVLLKNAYESCPKEVSETVSEKLGPSVIQREGQNQSARFRLRQAATSLKGKLEGRSMERPGNQGGNLQETAMCPSRKHAKHRTLFVHEAREWEKRYYPTRMGRYFHWSYSEYPKGLDLRP